MNCSKSCIYGNGIASEEFQEISQIAGIPEGKLPFRYLGVPIIAKRLAASDCSKLVERVMERIRAIGVRKLSYAGRLVLIKSVLSTLHCYWARIFILPVSILNKVEALCRSFLWQGKEISNGPALIAWDTCCKTKQEGGLGLIDLRRWNTAALGKYIWWIAQKEDHLWVKWIHNIYMKGVNWVDYKPNTGASWSWRKLCGVKDKLKAGYVNDWWLHQGRQYTISAGYSWSGMSNNRVAWTPFVWNSLSLPKHCLIGWIVANGKLLTRDRLMTIPAVNFMHWWLKLRLKNLLRKKIIAAGIQSLIYNIWEMRNRSRVDGLLLRPEKLIEKLLQNLRLRLQVLHSTGKISDNYREWI
ncbi:uncharacterized protein LOC141613705 [Silene latifolia]|uniref:uncharacterized protein LOC141613705 n=1 Tax=Silene latifolia TaxID=37657 RepID=UPI003D776B05